MTGIIEDIIANKVIFISSALSIILISLFFDGLYRFLNKFFLIEMVKEFGWVKAIKNFKIKNFQLFRHFDYFIAYLLALVIINYVIIIVLRAFIEGILISFSNDYGWFLTVLGVIIIAYISFVYYLNKNKSV